MSGASGRARRIVIAGAGIGGLTAALALARSGFDVDLFDRAPVLASAGAGLQLSPNATAALASLDLLDALRPAASAPDALQLHDARTGRVMAVLPLGAALRARHGFPYLVVHRADLQQTLLSAVEREPRLRLRLGHRVHDATSHARGVTALVLDGSRHLEAGGRALIAADGVWSGLRTSAFAAPPARRTGGVAWRASVPAEAAPPALRRDAVSVWMSTRGHAVAYPMRAGRHVNLVVLLPDASLSASLDRDWSDPSSPQALAQALEGWCETVRALVAGADRPMRWPIHEMPREGAWTRDGLAMIGDAAHAMEPHAAQGAGLALEDALTLAAALAGSDPEPAAVAASLGGWEALRRPRVERVRRAAHANRRIFQLPTPLSLGRDLVMRALGGTRLGRRQDWIHAWRPPGGSGSVSGGSG